MNILMFGPNGSGKGTQGELIQKAFGITHIESGVLFREHISKGTELGKQAKSYIDRGELVPDDITVPMILETLQTKGKNGWLLDGFPRNITQSLSGSMVSGSIKRILFVAEKIYDPQ